MRKLFATVIALTICLSMTILPFHVSAGSTSLADINKRLQQIENQKTKLQQSRTWTARQITQIKQDKSEAQNDLATLETEIDDVMNKIEAYQGQIDATKKEILQAGQALQDAEDRVASRDHLLRSRIRMMYMDGSVSFLDVLLSSTSFADFLQRYDLIATVVNQDKHILTANKKDRDLVAAKKAEVDQKLSSLETLYDKMNEQQNQLTEQKQNREVLIASLSNNQEYYENMSAEQENTYLKLAQEEAKLQAQKSKLVIKYGGGKLSWPFPKQYVITSPFGSRIDPITGKKGAFHNGLDIGAPGGTPVHAAADGEVLVARWYGGFGNCVIINHGDGLWTLYGHMRDGSLKVKQGETVKRGDVIGLVGQTGRATGNHLHFTVYKDEVAVNPLKYLP